MLVESGLCLTRFPARVSSDSVFRPRRAVTCELRNFGVLARREPLMSMIIETPNAIISREIIKAWWSLRTGALVVGVVGANGG